MLRKCLVLILLAIAALASADAKRVTSYADLVKALDSGRSVKAIYRYGKMKLVADGKEEAGPDAVGGTEIKTWERFAKGAVRNDREFLSTSETVLISSPRGSYLYNYVRVRFYADNTVEITARYLKPGTYEVVMDELFKGKISDGKSEGGVELFAQ